MPTATAKVIQLAGLWEFDDAANPAKATFGNDLIFEGTAPTRSASVADDFAGTLDGVMLTPPPANRTVSVPTTPSPLTAAVPK